MLDLQFSHLGADEHRILNSGSVVGERFSVWAVRPTLDIETDRIEDLLEGLAEKQQFVRSAGLQELPDGSVSAHYEFKHVGICFTHPIPTDCGFGLVLTPG